MKKIITHPLYSLDKNQPPLTCVTKIRALPFKPPQRLLLNSSLIRSNANQGDNNWCNLILSNSYC